MNNHGKRLGRIFCLFFICLVTAPFAQITTITPGQGIGAVHIGDDMKSAVRHCGWKSPKINHDTAGTSRLYYLVYEKERVVFVFKSNLEAGFKDSKLDTIKIMNPLFVIEETGERVGGERVSTDPKPGVLFTVDKKNRITSIAVFRPTP
jgi:hypothetical protein